MSGIFEMRDLILEDYDHSIYMGIDWADWNSEIVCVDLKYNKKQHISGCNLIGINYEGLILCNNICNSHPCITSIDLISNRRLKVIGVDMI